MGIYDSTRINAQIDKVREIERKVIIVMLVENGVNLIRKKEVIKNRKE